MSKYQEVSAAAKQASTDWCEYLVCCMDFFKGLRESLLADWGCPKGSLGFVWEDDVGDFHSTPIPEVNHGWVCATLRIVCDDNDSQSSNVEFRLRLRRFEDKFHLVLADVNADWTFDYRPDGHDFSALSQFIYETTLSLWQGYVAIRLEPGDEIGEMGFHAIMRNK